MALVQGMVVRRSVWARVWQLRRWLYAAYMVVAVLRIPARVGFHLLRPVCDANLTLANARVSMTKVPHVVLFALFFAFTMLQFDRLSVRALAWSLLATCGLGVLVELEEGATRTGNCRLTDVLPDVAGALVVGAALVAVLIWRAWSGGRCRSTPTSVTPLDASKKHDSIQV